nr:unnamed protein product [Digitaria exilis]
MANIVLAAVRPLLGLLLSEAQLLRGVRSDVQFITDEMDSIKGFLMKLAGTKEGAGDDLQVTGRALWAAYSGWHGTPGASLLAAVSPPVSGSSKSGCWRSVHGSSGMPLLYLPRRMPAAAWPWIGCCRLVR